MTAAGNFMKSNMLFWLFPIVLLSVKVIFDLIPYKPLFFAVTAIIIGVSAVIIKKNRVQRNLSVTKELEEMELEDSADYSNYGEKNAADRIKKVVEIPLAFKMQN